MYAKDWDAQTADLRASARGIYHSLLCQQWERGGLASDPVVLAQLGRCTAAEFRAAWPALESHFPLCADGLRRNARLERIRADQRAARERRRQAGAKGAAKGHALRPRIADPHCAPAMRSISPSNLQTTAGNVPVEDIPGASQRPEHVGRIATAIARTGGSAA